MTELATRAQAFRLIADGVAAGLSAPWRLYLARGSRYLSLNVGDRLEWNSWRAHLGCPEISVRVYQTDYRFYADGTNLYETGRTAALVA